ncbi:MAG: hypothetical protein OQK01_07745, partial [Xanthomonadales bacterium]|nr:hypothetical protein [Xanthomonadales bacterium]
MTGRRLLLHSLFLFLLPVIVAWWGLSVAGAIALVLLALLWRWAISLSAIAAPARVPDLALETISASHFVEKVRWCMDRLGVDYVEQPTGGALGAFFLGRTVPVLKFCSGAVRSSIGNSPEILRYLWGRYAAERGEQAEFLRPTPDRLEFEARVDRCGVDLQVWVYHHILDDRELTLQAWGANSPRIPAWQRLVLQKEQIIPLFDPPFDRSSLFPGYIRGYPPGVRENGGQYTHGSIWFAMAMARKGDGGKAVQMLKMMSPIEHSSGPNKTTLYGIEPYVVAADIYRLAGSVGKGGWSWYTGSAAWMYRAWVEEILGIKRRGDVLIIDPVIPPSWNGFSVTFHFNAAE